MPAQAVIEEIAQYLAWDSGLEMLCERDIITCSIPDPSPEIQIEQLLSGINSNTAEAALSLMCVATRNT